MSEASPPTFEVVIEPGGHRVRARAGETLLDAARRAGVWIPFECGWGSCSTCKVTLLEGEVECLFPQAPAIRPQDARRRRILACQAVPRTDVRIKALRVDDRPPEDLPTADYRGVLTERCELAPSIWRLVFDLDREATFRPGQYAVLELEPGLRRCYSMDELPHGRRVSFIAKRYPGGRGSTRLTTLGPGSEVPVILPFGRAYLRETERAPVFAAGGTGIAPILSLLRQVVAEGWFRDREVLVVYGANTPEELAARDELEELVAALPQGRLVLAAARAPEDWPGVRGFVTHALEQALGEDWQREYWMAGPPAMVNAVLALLKERGVEITRVHYDSFG